jgi:2-dehydro-3-deoxygluconokinase
MRKHKILLLLFSFMASLDLVCIGHLVYDIRDYIEAFPSADRTVHLRMPPQISAGGSAANVALNARRLGHSSGLIANVGDDPHGRFILSELAKDGVDLAQTKLIKKGRTGLSVILIDPNGEVMVIEDLGCADWPRRMPAQYIRSAKWVHIAGCSLEWMKQASSIASKIGLPISFDPGRAASKLGKKALDPILKRVDLLIINRKELAAITGSFSIEGVKALSKEYQCSVVLKQGSGPALSSTSGHELFSVPSFRAPKVVDTLGAGDAFDAGVICGKLENRSLYEAITMGHACAAAKVMHAGAQSMPKKEKIKKLFKF